MTYPVLLDVTDGVATLTLNRPAALNALSVDMMKALADATARLAHRDDLRVVVVEGAGDHFMAGGDLKDFAAHLHLSPESRLATFRAMIEQYINQSVEALQGLPVPVIARVQGACAGFGLSLVLGCDMVPAAELDAAVADLVARVVRGPGRCYGEIKHLLNASPDQSLGAQLQLEAEAFARCTARPDFDEGINAFLGKRKARFNG